MSDAPPLNAPIYNFSFGAGASPTPEKKDPPKPPSKFETMVKNLLLNVVNVWFAAAVVAGIIVTGWTVLFAWAWFQNGAAVLAAICLSLACVCGHTVVTYLKDRRPELSETAQVLWVCCVLFAAVAAVSTVYKYNVGSLSSLQSELSSIGGYMPLANAKRRMYYAQSQAEYDYYLSEYRRSERAIALEKSVEHEESIQPIDRVEAAASTLALYLFLVAFASFGFSAGVEASAAILTPKDKNVTPDAPVAPVEPVAAAQDECRARRATEVVNRNRDWVMPGVIEAGVLSLLGGPPGVGKTTLGLTMAATISSGRTWPDGSEADEGLCVICELEDNEETDTKPRLIAAGANLKNIIFCDLYDLSTELEALKKDVAKKTPWGAPPLRFFMISPMIRFFGKSGNNDPNAIRDKMAPLQAWARKDSFAALGIAHLVPGKTDEFNGSKAYMAASRGAWSAIRNKGHKVDDPNDQQRILFSAKVNNTSDKDLYYRIKAVNVGSIETTKVVWDRVRIGQWNHRKNGSSGKQGVELTPTG